jgi:hypothetical protein
MNGEGLQHGASIDMQLQSERSQLCFHEHVY